MNFKIIILIETIFQAEMAGGAFSLKMLSKMKGCVMFQTELPLRDKIKVCHKIFTIVHHHQRKL